MKSNRKYYEKVRCLTRPMSSSVRYNLILKTLGSPDIEQNKYPALIVNLISSVTIKDLIHQDKRNSRLVSPPRLMADHAFILIRFQKL